MYKPYRPSDNDINLAQDTLLKLQKDMCKRYDNPNDVLSPLFYKNKMEKEMIISCDKILEECNHNSVEIIKSIRKIENENQFGDYTNYCIRYILRTEESMIEHQRLNNLLDIDDAQLNI